MVVDASNYTVEEGSTIVTFKAAYLETLSAGAHTVTLNYTGERSVNTVLTILAQTTEDESAEQQPE